jgi:hypothetical protein
MENSEKRVITPEFILKNKMGGAAWRGLKIGFGLFFIGLFCLFLLLMLGLIGFILDIAIIAGYIIFKKKQKKNTLNAYFRTMPLVKTGAFETGAGSDDDDHFYIYKGDFGAGPNGKELWAEFGFYEEYANSTPGEHYYVGFYANTDKPFICYKCDNNVLDPSIELR